MIIRTLTVKMKSSKMISFLVLSYREYLEMLAC
jgi:hypothetical protein